MPLRPPAGFISAFYNPLQVPNAPTGVSASAGDAQATVSFTAPTNVGGGAITGYGAAAVKTSDGTTLTNTGASSPITVTGLTNGSAYTMNVWAINSFGPSPFGTSGSVTPTASRGLFGAGYNTGSTVTNIIDYVTIGSAGNATDFGDLTVAGGWLSACSSTTRGVFIDGLTRGVTMDYVTIMSTGNATDFGDLTAAGGFTASCSNETRGITAVNSGNVLNYITIASAGNASDYGDLSVAGFGLAGCASSTRGLFGGGYRGGNSNVIDYVTIDTLGNATDFGDLTLARFYLGAASSSTRGLFAGGYANGEPNPYNVIDYVTISSAGNATDFGDLTQAGNGVSGTSSPVRAIFSTRQTTYADYATGTNVIDYVTIASTGNASDFGDLTVTRSGGAACSNGHGGLA